MIKVDIVSGFLGAGKTTFMKELLEKVFVDEKIVLIENEFGEVSIDSQFLQSAGIRIAEMNSGCICCTLAGDFARSLKQVAGKYHPDRIIIEPSGVGKLSDVTEAVRSVQKEAGLVINSMITIVDGKKMKLYLKNFNEFFSDQIRHASTIVLSRTQILDEEALQDCMELIREYNHDAAVITTPWDKLTGTALLDAISHGRDLATELAHDHHEHHHDHHDYKCAHGCHDHGHHAHHHHADEVFDSWSIQTVRSFDRAELEDTLKLMGMTDGFGTVLRAKGIVKGNDEQWMEFDMVPEEVEIRSCTPDYTGRVCIIGTELNEAYLAQTFGR